MKAILFPAVALALVCTQFLTSTVSALDNVRSVKITNTRVDWFYIEELEILNAGGTDVASSAFGATVMATGTPAFGSILEGAIDDLFGPCCGTGWHSSDNTSVHEYVITLPTPETIIGDITMWNRQDGCCPERMDGMLFEFFSDENGLGALLGSVQVDGLGTDANDVDGASFPVPGSAVDDDGDGLPNAYEAANGLDPNSAVGDDGADGDPDGDSLTNIQEFGRRTDPQSADSDEDGLTDDVESGTRVFVDETDTGTDPVDADSDDDGLTDGVESNTGDYVDANDTGTNPLDADSDGDALDDGVEDPELPYDSNNPTIQPGSNPTLADTDGDGSPDGFEVNRGSDPTDPDSRPPALTGGSVNGVRSVRITNTRADWFYIEEIEILNTLDEDVASLAFSSTAAANSGPGFGSSFNGAIDDQIGNCCGTGWHSGDNAGPNVHMYTITFPTQQNLAGVVTVWNRLDGCCPERLDGLLFEYFGGDDGTGNLIASQQIDNLATDNADTISTPGGASFSLPAPTTPLKIVDFSVSPSDGATRITWSSVPGATYAVFAASDLTLFVEIDDGVGSIGDETTFEFTDGSGIDAPRRYYKVERVQ